MILPILLLGLTSFAISWAATFAMKRLAPKLGFVDKPGGRKIHANPKPLGGGVAIFWAFVLPMFVGLMLIHFIDPPVHEKTFNAGDADGIQSFLRSATQPSPFPISNVTVRVPVQPITNYWLGVRQQTPMALTFIGALLVMHVMGIFDDRKALGPYVKLVVQLVAAAALVIPFKQARVLTALGPTVSIMVSILWITAITNAFNFLDNMDGLSAGIAAVCTVAFLVAALSIAQWFVAGSLALLLGALLGFLCFNFPPATIFMGDSGSLVVGFILGVLTIRTTYLLPGENFGAGWYAVFAPIIVLAVPLYDLIVVSIIRIGRGKSPFVGDTNHFSHRLVARGMSKRTAVLCLYLITAATAVAAILLPHVHSTWAAMLIFAQTLLILGVVALLEQHPLPTIARDTGFQPLQDGVKEPATQTSGKV
jgi:UDP-GlcNAc:undecaprenyl-phosphate GlcNAc-1-phosphate transferase